MTHVLGHYTTAGGNEFFPRNYLTAEDMKYQVSAWQKAGVPTEDMNRRLLGATVAGFGLNAPINQTVVSNAPVNISETPIGQVSTSQASEVSTDGGQNDHTGLPSFLTPETVLGEAPKATFFSFQNQFGRGPAQRNYFQGQFQDIFNQYLGSWGQQIRQGQTPTKTFLDFMGDFNFSEQFGQIPPSIRGGTTGRFAPTARFMNF